MEATDWIYIVGTLFLGGCALFVPYLAEIVKRKAFAPNLKILFELAPPFCHKTNLRSPRGSPTQIDEPVYYFRFKVSRPFMQKYTLRFFTSLICIKINIQGLNSK